jgi:glycosyltransferase involved in cell wall biosynthesis
MNVLLVGNYEFDGSTSMKIWAGTLLRELKARGVDAKLISPKPVFGRLRRSSEGLGKWLGYIDRFVLFPQNLRAAAAHADVVHVCDHGNAIYVSALNGKPIVVTCHDMLAVRGALGEVPDCPASMFGRLLQRRIGRGLKRASRVACVSQATFNDSRRILGSERNLCVILEALNYPFQQLPPDEAGRRLAAIETIERPFVLHVGSSLTRKNREGVLRIFAKAVEKVDLQLVFAGEPLSRNQSQLAHELQLSDRIVQVVKPDVEIIEALYNRAVALLFPSRYEGFGWPPIEAQACGCPVVASDIPPLIEVLRESAIVRQLDDESGMAESIVKLAVDKEYREILQRSGFENVRSRFQTSRMMNEYVLLYRELACQS